MDILPKDLQNIVYKYSHELKLNDVLDELAYNIIFGYISFITTIAYIITTTYGNTIFPKKCKFILFTRKTIF